MSSKQLPFTKEWMQAVVEKYPTPFHIYDESAIRKNAKELLNAFDWVQGFKEYFAVKANPNPTLMSILREEGFGADCSSLPELLLAERVGIVGEEIMFSSNETPAPEFVKARQLGAIVNLDDITHVEFLEKNGGIPEVISFRYNPGDLRKGSTKIMGDPVQAKYGLTRQQIFDAFKMASQKGAKRFGLHAFLASNVLDPSYHIETARMLFELAVDLQKELGLRVEFVNLSGGLGIPYRPEDSPMDLNALSGGIRQAYDSVVVPNGLHPTKIFWELGRKITGPFGYLVTQAIHKKEIHKNYIGVDACMANLMRPAMYGAYHHITVLGKENAPHDQVYDIVGSLCENCDKFAIDRPLPKIDIGDILVIHDTGAHGYAMGFNYNGKLRSAELLMKPDGEVKLIRRAETVEDYFATLNF